MDRFTGSLTIHTHKDKTARQAYTDECVAKANQTNSTIDEADELLEDVMKRNGFFDIETNDNCIQAYYSGKYTDNIHRIFDRNDVMDADGKFDDYEEGGSFKITRKKENKSEMEDAVFLSALSDETLMTELIKRNFTQEALLSLYKACRKEN